MTCPYCPKPLPVREGAVTCASAACIRRHRAYLERQRYAALGGALSSKRRQHRADMQDGRCCAVCGDAFYVRVRTQVICARPRCRNQQRERLRAERERMRQAVTIVSMDLTTAQIDQKLASLAAQRRATRSWLRIEDPWQQKSGCELHKRVDVQTYDLEGAMQ
jgi:uncharacterized protein with FMN-binding domain